MTFEHPLRFALALVLAAALVALYLVLARRKTEHDLAYSHLPFFMGAARPLRWVPAAFAGAFAAGLVALTCAAGEPRVNAPVPVRDGSVFICIDTSGSMAAGDIVPTRAAAALDAARTFIEASPRGTRIGLIAFSGTASIVQPLTADRAQAEASLAAIPPPSGATAIGDALRLAAGALPSSGHRLIVLITDGVNNTGVDPEQVAEWLGTQHVPVYTIGIGTASGGEIPGSSDEATIDEGALQSYASASGGAYARVQTATELRDALGHLGRVTGFERKPVDATPGFTIAGIALVLGTFLAGLGLGRFP